MFNNMSDQDLEDQLRDLSREIERRAKLSNQRKELASKVSDIVYIAKSVAVSSGDTAWGELSSFLPEDFLSWVSSNFSVTGHVKEVFEWTNPRSTGSIGYAKGSEVLFQGVKYVSVEDNNMYSPVANPRAWRKENGVLTNG